MRNSKSQSVRGGFTLIELLVVMGLIAFLTTITVMIVGTMIGSARAKATRATITKVSTILEDRLRAFDMAFTQHKFDPEIETEALNYSSLSPAQANKVATIVVRKQKFRDAFPQPAATSTETGNPKAMKARSAEVLYELLTTGKVDGVAEMTQISFTPIGADSFLSSELGDTDGDGKLEILDSWGEPLRWYPWPTQLVQDAAALKLHMPNLSDETRQSDPDDPLRLLENMSGFNADDFHDPNVYHAILIVSSGPDTVLGLFEPPDRTNQGHLAKPDDSSADTIAGRNDNITNRQPSGGN